MGAIRLKISSFLRVIFALTLSFIEVTIALPAHLAGLDEKPRTYSRKQGKAHLCCGKIY
jgi:hypothetical protein